MIPTGDPLKTVLKRIALAAPRGHRRLSTRGRRTGRRTLARRFARRTPSVELSWHLLPEGGMSARRSYRAAPRSREGRELPRHRAVLTLPEGTRLSMVVETSTSEVLAFPRPPRP